MGTLPFYNLFVICFFLATKLFMLNITRLYVFILWHLMMCDWFSAKERVWSFQIGCYIPLMWGGGAMLQIPALWKMNVTDKPFHLPLCITFMCECLMLVIMLYFDFNTVSRSIQSGSRALLANGYRGLFPGLKRPRHEADRWPPSSAEVNSGGAIPALPNVSLWHCP
jgi:hypothetical protein